MEKRVKLVATFIFAVLLITLLYLFSDWFSKTTGYSIAENPNNNLAKCLTSQGVKLYGSKTCPDCTKQKEFFGKEAFDYVDYVECSQTPVKCSEIKSVPAWSINNDTIYGIKTLDELRYLTNCY